MGLVLNTAILNSRTLVVKTAKGVGGGDDNDDDGNEPITVRQRILQIMHPMQLQRRSQS